MSGSTITSAVLGEIAEEDFSTLYHGYRQPGSRRPRVFWVGFGKDGGDGLLPQGTWAMEFEWGRDGAGAMALARALIDHATGRAAAPVPCPIDAPVESFYAVEFYRSVVRRMPDEWEFTAQQLREWLFKLGGLAATGGLQ